MPTALLALLLLAVTVDPRLAPALETLAEARDAAGRPIGQEYVRLPRVLQVDLVVAPLAAGQGGRYDAWTRTVTIAEAALAEDPRVVATILAHELCHASDADVVAFGLLESDCAELEARGYQAGAEIAPALWPDGLPNSTEAERGISGSVNVYERDGLDGLRSQLSTDAVRCTSIWAP